MEDENQIGTAELQREQQFLVKLERELNTVLAKIDDNINALKVEELQLQSNAVNLPDTADKAPESTAVLVTKQEKQAFVDNPDIVNRQELDLDVFISNFNEENDE